jgi:mono/diheme cytochrome c family protein
VGADLFFRETFNGNGRSCGTCHPVANNFTIDPPFISALSVSDPTNPLFVAELNPALSQLEKPAQMHARALILENVDGFAPDPTTRFVMRSVPHNLSLATSITRAATDPVTTPADRTGWSGDGAPGAGTLRDFQTGAIMQHYTKSLNRVAGTDFRLATSDELDAIEQFMRQLGRTNELTLTNVTMTDTRADHGRNLFLTVGCNACHGNAGANASFGGGGNRNFNTGVETSRSNGLTGIPVDGGFLATSATPAGPFGDGTFNAPPLIEAVDTPPFFHTDVTITGSPGHDAASAATIEEAISFYSTAAFNSSPSGVVAPIHMTATDIDDVGRFLRGLNAVFNAAQTIKRLDAAAQLQSSFAMNQNAFQQQNLFLAQKEAKDARAVLQAFADLDADAVTQLTAAINQLDTAQNTTSASARSTAISSARTKMLIAISKISTNVTFNIGAASVMF